MNVAELGRGRARSVDGFERPRSRTGAHAAALSRLVAGVSLGGRVSRTGLALSPQVVDADLARLEAVEEGFEVGDADGDNGEALHQLDGNGGLPGGKGKVGRGKGHVGVIYLDRNGWRDTLRPVSSCALDGMSIKTYRMRLPKTPMTSIFLDQDV